MGDRLPRLSRRDSERLADIGRALEVFHLGGEEIWVALGDQLKQLLGSSATMIYGLRAGADGSVGPSFCHSPELAHSLLRRALDELLRRQLMAYDPVAVPAAERNRSVLLADLDLGDEHREEWTQLVRRAMSISPSDQVRMLVCEGSTALAWVGGFCTHEEKFGPKKRRLLQALADPLGRRFAFEERLRRRPLIEATLQAALEGIDGPAYLVDGRGHAVLSNASGRLALDRHPAESRSSCVEAVAGDRRCFRLTEVRGHGLPAHYLLTARSDGVEGGARLLDRSARWLLTRREGAVLELVARGLTTAAIARELGCAVRTIELHMTRLLQKARVENRASLIARFWGSTD